MAITNSSPSVASGSDWLNPSNALADGGGSAVLPGGAANGWLVLEGFAGIPNETIIGIEVVAEVDAFNATVLGALLWQANLADCGDDASAVADSNGSTWYGWTSAGNTRGVTALYDFGSPTTVGKFSLIGEVYGEGTPSWGLQYSADGITWSNAPTATAPLLPAGPQVVNITEDLATLGVGLTPVTARYWRGCLQDSSTLGDAEPRIYTLTLFAEDRTTVLTASPTLTRTLEMAASRSGSPTDIHSVALPPGGGLVSVGGPTALFSQSWIPADFNSGTAAIYIRRGSGSGEHLASARSLDRAYLIVYSTAIGGSFGTATMSVTRKCFIAIEKDGSGVSARGIPKAATNRVMSAMVDFTPDFDINRHNVMGSKLPEKFTMNKISSEGSMDEGKPCYNEIGFWLAGICGAPVSTEISTGVWQHTFTLKSNSQDDIRSYSVEIGEDAGAAGGKKVAYAILNQLGFEMSREDISLTGAFLGQKIQEPVTLSTGANDVQTVTVTATGGNYAYSLAGAHSASLAHSANAAAIQVALRAMSTINGANVTVTGSGPYTITFNGALASKLMEKLKIVDLGLTGGTVTVAHTTFGGIKELDVVPIQPGDISLYYATTFALLPTNKFSGVATSGFEIGDRFNVRWVQDRAKESWSKHVEGMPSVTLKVTAESVPLIGSPESGYTGATGISLWQDCQAGAQRFVRFEAVSAALVAAGFPYSLTITMFAGISDGGGYENSDNTIDRDIEFTACMNDDWGKGLEIILVNGVAAPGAGQSAY